VDRQPKITLASTALATFPVSSNPRGVIIFFHPTTVNREEVPSNPACKAYRALAAYFASQNYAVLMPDSLGQGQGDISFIHPYILYSQANAKAAITFLKYSFLD
jgi:dienelactone hydrolase